MKPQHTPTPWEVEKRDHGDVVYFCLVKGNAAIADCGIKSNAEFIVRAVNSYEALLKLAKDFKQYLHESYDEDNIPLMQAVNKAIQEAEG